MNGDATGVLILSGASSFTGNATVTQGTLLLGADVAAACTRLVTIPGGGAVESLNVSVAAAVLMWELMVRKTP
jgi:autotransporter-associated beta strand protein